MSATYPPYVNAYGNLSKLFGAIKTAAVPPKFTNDFMNTVLGLKSTSYRAMIPLLKRLGFLDQSNVPTQAYKDYREDEKSGAIMFSQLKPAYADLYTANEYAHKLTKAEVTSKLKTLVGASADDKVIPNVAGTFLELVKLSKFDGVHKKKKEPEGNQGDGDTGHGGQSGKPLNLGLSYTINLNLPATTEIEVFNAIFKSLSPHYS
jgi:hypothetical protein